MTIINYIEVRYKRQSEQCSYFGCQFSRQFVDRQPLLKMKSVFPMSHIDLYINRECQDTEHAPRAVRYHNFLASLLRLTVHMTDPKVCWVVCPGYSSTIVCVQAVCLISSTNCNFDLVCDTIPFHWLCSMVSFHVTGSSLLICHFPPHMIVTIKDDLIIYGSVFLVSRLTRAQASPCTHPNPLESPLASLCPLTHIYMSILGNFPGHKLTGKIPC